MTKCLELVTWLKDWFYTKTEIDTKLSWQQVYTSTDIKVYSNGQMVEVYFNKNGLTANAWSTISTGVVPSEYRPTESRDAFVNAYASNTARMVLDSSNGKIVLMNSISNVNAYNTFVYAKR